MTDNVIPITRAEDPKAALITYLHSLVEKVEIGEIESVYAVEMGPTQTTWSLHGTVHPLFVVGAAVLMLDELKQYALDYGKDEG